MQNLGMIPKWCGLSKKVLTFFADNDIISYVVSKTKITNPIWNAEVSELADEQD